MYQMRQTTEIRLVSVLVRRRNDAAFLARTLDALAVQECPFAHEVLVCDDGSTDGTSEILRACPEVRLVARPAGAYRPGRTLNALVRAARGEIAVFNNADAVPLDRQRLANLVAPLVDGSADATFANQLPRPDATPLVRKDSERAFGDGSVSARWPRFFSLASSAARRDDLLAHPFDEDLLYSEDVEWVNRRADFRRRYVPTARVEHSHNYTSAQLARRFYGEGYAEAQIFGEPVPSLLRVLGGACAEALRDGAYLCRARAFSLRALGAALRRRLIQRFAAQVAKTLAASLLADVRTASLSALYARHAPAGNAPCVDARPGGLPARNARRDDVRAGRLHARVSASERLRGGTGRARRVVLDGSRARTDGLLDPTLARRARDRGGPRTCADGRLLADDDGDAGGAVRRSGSPRAPLSDGRGVHSHPLFDVREVVRALRMDGHRVCCVFEGEPSAEDWIGERSSCPDVVRASRCCTPSSFCRFGFDGCSRRCRRCLSRRYVVGNPLFLWCLA